MNIEKRNENKCLLILIRYLLNFSEVRVCMTIKHVKWDNIETLGISHCCYPFLLSHSIFASNNVNQIVGISFEHFIFVHWLNCLFAYTDKMSQAYTNAIQLHTQMTYHMHRCLC